MIYTLADITDEYLMERHIQKKKYFAPYLLHAKWTWKNLFWNTLYSVQSVWQEMKFDGEDYYIDLPEGCMRLLSVSYVPDKFPKINTGRNIYELFYNEKMNVVTKKNTKCCKCGCSCNCGGTCEDVNSFSVVSTYLFSQNGVDYYEKDWIEYCCNGDIIEWKEIPTKKYNDIIGDVGDYNYDYNNDYNRPVIFSNYEIVIEKVQTKLCTLEALPCGCPANTQVNTDCIRNFCGCYIPSWRMSYYYSREELKTGNINPDCAGTIKLSECGTKIIYLPQERNSVQQFVVPKCLLVNFQTNGESCSETIIVPDYSVDCIKFGIDYRYKMFNNTFSRDEKKEAKYAWNEAQSNLIQFRNQLSLEWLGEVQDTPILF